MYSVSLSAAPQNQSKANKFSDRGLEEESGMLHMLI